MENTEGVTTPPETAILESLAEILRANGYTAYQGSRDLPAKLRDCEGDIWHLRPNGKYSLYEDSTNAMWTLDELRDPENGLAPLKVTEVTEL